MWGAMVEGSVGARRGSVVARRDGRGWSAAGQCGGEFCLEKWFDIDKYCLGGDSPTFFAGQCCALGLG